MADADLEYQWNGTETAQEWFDRTDPSYRAESGEKPEGADA